MLGLEPNLFSAVLLIVVTGIGLVSFLPQIVKTLKLKKSGDIAILSWIIWIISYLLMAVYAFAFTKDPVYFFLELIEGSICLFTLLICLKYRNCRD